MYKPKNAKAHPQVSRNEHRDKKTPWKHLKKVLGVAVVTAVVFLLAGCSINPGTVTSVDDSRRVFRYVDTDYNVVCWSNLRDGGIDCIPVSNLDPDPGTNLEANP